VDDGSWVNFVNNNIYNKEKRSELFKETQKFSNEGKGGLYPIDKR
jgi:hypothetical protein